MLYFTKFQIPIAAGVLWRTNVRFGATVVTLLKTRSTGSRTSLAAARQSPRFNRKSSSERRQEHYRWSSTTCRRLQANSSASSKRSARFSSPTLHGKIACLFRCIGKVKTYFISLGRINGHKVSESKPLKMELNIDTLVWIWPNK